MKNGNRERGMIPVLEVVLAAVVLSLAGSAIYVGLHHKGTQSTAKASVTPSATPRSTSPSPSLTSSVAKTSNKFDIPELGVKMTLPAGLTGLTYTTYLNQSGTDGNGKAYKFSYVRVTTKTLAAADSQCASGALGDLALYSFDPVGNLMDVGAANTRQIGQDYLVYAEPQATCSGNETIENTQTSLTSLMKQAFDSALPIKQ